MNEYEVTVIENGQQRKLTLMAASATQARDLAEDGTDGEVTAVRFVRAASFSCTIRDGRPSR
jgi:hypothetical protein